MNTMVLQYIKNKAAMIDDENAYHFEYYIYNSFSFAVHGIFHLRIYWNIGIYILANIFGTLFRLESLVILNTDDTMYQKVDNAVIQLLKYDVLLIVLKHQTHEIC